MGALRDPRNVRPLTMEKRALLLVLSVEDHYVRVRTTKGDELILMRLTDAIIETDPVPGVRAHGSRRPDRADVTGASDDG